VFFVSRAVAEDMRSGLQFGAAWAGWVLVPDHTEVVLPGEGVARFDLRK
jgi:hypothetical protein